MRERIRLSIWSSSSPINGAFELGLGRAFFFYRSRRRRRCFARARPALRSSSFLRLSVIRSSNFGASGIGVGSGGSIESQTFCRGGCCCFFFLVIGFDGVYSVCRSCLPVRGRSHSSSTASYLQAPLELHRAHLPAFYCAYYLHGPGNATHL